MKSLLARLERLERAKAADELRRQESTQIVLRPVLSCDEWLAWVSAHQQAGTEETLKSARLIINARGTAAWGRFMAEKSLECVAT